MDFELSDSQRQRATAIRDFATNQLSPGAGARDAEARFDRDVWQLAADFGLAGLAIEPAWGGSGLGALDTAIAVEALGRGCEDLGLVFSLCAHQFACALPISRSGSDEQKACYLRQLAQGRIIGANAITESESGSDVFAMRCRAEPDGDGYVLDGAKCFVTNAPAADLFLIYAATKPERKLAGISAFLVPRDTKGLVVGQGHPKTGLRSSPWGELYLDGCRLPASARLGREGAGATIFRQSMAWERGCLFAAYVGAMERTLERCLQHARKRYQFGRPIGHNQAISHRLVDMKLRLETSRLLLYRATWQIGRSRRAEQDLALSKLWISECAVQTGLDAIQVFGGSGVVTNSGVDCLLRDALPARIFSGSSEMQREIVARLMGLG